MSVVEVYGIHYEADLSREHIATLVFGESCTAADGPAWHTPAHDPLQVATTHYGKGSLCKMHTHPARDRKAFVGPAREVLVIKAGRLKMDFADRLNRFAGQYVVGPGDVVVIHCGAHALEALDDVELVEVKQGPFDARYDKVYL